MRVWVETSSWRKGGADGGLMDTLHISPDNCTVSCAVQYNTCTMYHVQYCVKINSWIVCANQFGWKIEIVCLVYPTFLPYKYQILVHCKLWTTTSTRIEELGFSRVLQMSLSIQDRAAIIAA